MPANSYVTLGRSGLRVSPFTLGTMTFGDDHGWGTSPAESADDPRRVPGPGRQLDRHGQHLHRRATPRRSSATTSRAHPDRRDRVVLGTKFFGNLYTG